MTAPAPAFTTTEKQNELFEVVLRGERTIIGFGGGIRGTKTFGLLSLFMVLGRIYPGSRWIVVRKDLERIRKNTLPSFEKLRELSGGYWSPVNGQTFQSRAQNGSVIAFFGENIEKDPDLSRWKGLEANGFGLEEADELAEASLYKAIERAGAWIVPNLDVQPLPWVVCTFNPNASWPARLFYEPWMAGTLRPPYAFIPATIEDNPYAPESYRKNLKNLPPELYARFVESDWAAVTGKFYKVDARTHLLPRSALPYPLPSWWEYWGSYDWGFAHWAVFCAWAMDADGNTYLLDSCWMRGEQDSDMADTIIAALPARCLKEVYAGHDCWAKVQARGGSGITTAEVFEAKGIYLIEADTDRVNSARVVREALHARPLLNSDGTPLLHADGQPLVRVGVRMVDTEGNRRILAQLMNTMPDPKNIHKPLKVDADSMGNGGDDGENAFRYGLATRFKAPADPTPGEHARRERAQLDTLSQQEAKAWDKQIQQLTRKRYFGTG